MNWKRKASLTIMYNHRCTLKQKSPWTTEKIGYSRAFGVLSIRRVYIRIDPHQIPALPPDDGLPVIPDLIFQGAHIFFLTGTDPAVGGNPHFYFPFIPAHCSPGYSDDHYIIVLPAYPFSRRIPCVWCVPHCPVIFLKVLYYLAGGIFSVYHPIPGLLIAERPYDRPFSDL